MKLIALFSKKSPFTSSIGLGRSLLALSTFCTLLFNNVNDLTFFNRMLFEANPNNALQNISIFYLFPQDILWIAKGISMFILALVIIGWRPRLTGIFHWWIAASFMISNTVISGGDQIAANMTLFLIPLTLMDSRKWHWKTKSQKDSIWTVLKNIVGNFILCILILQVAIIYLEASIAKMPVEEWGNGTALYYWFNNSVFGAPNYINWIIQPIISNKILLPILTHSVLIFELFLFTGIFATKKIRRIMLKMGIAFHVGIILIHGIFGFAIVMFGALTIYLSYDMELKITKRIRKFGLRINNTIQHFGK